MKNYMLKEYGSWSVLTVAFAAGLVVSRAFPPASTPLFFALGLLINSKQAFMKWVRGQDAGTALQVFIGQIAVAALVFVLIFGDDIYRLLPFAILPAVYLVSNRTTGEHSLSTELLGFGLLSMAGLLSRFLATGLIDMRLFAAAAMYFGGGVFKVRVLLQRRMRDRLMSLLFLIAAVWSYHSLRVPLMILLPLIDNFIATAAPYRLKLRTTGWIEVGKSLMFLFLMLIYF